MKDSGAAFLVPHLWCFPGTRISLAADGWRFLSFSRRTTKETMNPVEMVKQALAHQKDGGGRLVNSLRASGALSLQAT